MPFENNYHLSTLHMKSKLQEEYLSEERWNLFSMQRHIVMTVMLLCNIAEFVMNLRIHVDEKRFLSSWNSLLFIEKVIQEQEPMANPSMPLVNNYHETWAVALNACN